MERTSQGSDSKPVRKLASAKDTDIVASGDTGVHSGLGKTNGWIKDYVRHPFDPDLDWRNPPQTPEFGGKPIPASVRQKANRSSDLAVPGAFQWHINPWYDTPHQPLTVDEMVKFEKAKEAALLKDFSGAQLWGMLFGAIPALLFVCGYLAGGRSTATWFVLSGYVISLVASLVVVPKLADRWLQTDKSIGYNKSVELFISNFYCSFTILGSMLVGFPLMMVTAIILR